MSAKTPGHDSLGSFLNVSDKVTSVLSVWHTGVSHGISYMMKIGMNICLELKINASKTSFFTDLIEFLIVSHESYLYFDQNKEKILTWCVISW